MFSKLYCLGGGALLILALTVAAVCAQTLFDDRAGTVVIDPGHGGHDPGAKGPGGVLEKDVTLALARLIVGRLEDRYRVVLTRTDDYDLAPFKRAGTANHERADLFVSLHTGAAFMHQAGGATIFSHRPPQEPSEGIAALWERTQDRHTQASARLARTLQAHLSAQPALAAAPLIVLGGADMPAVLVEVAQLTNPVEEKRLTEPQGLAEIAAGLAKGIEAYLSRPPSQ